MAYTTECKTCEKKVSSEAKHCPHCGQPDPACFPGTAMILTPSGWMQIAALQERDQVVSFSVKQQKLVNRIVTKKHQHAASIIWEIKTKGVNKPLRVTPIHRFLTHRGWIMTKDLKQNDELLSFQEDGSSSFKRVDSIRSTKEKEPVYNLHTTGEHNFIVEGFIAHNFAYFPRLRSVLHNLFIDPFYTFGQKNSKVLKNRRTFSFQKII